MKKNSNLNLEVLTKRETYSLILSAIYASEADPEYALLSDLMNIMDDKTFKAFLTLFEGQTIKVPSMQQLTEMLRALQIYTYRDIDGLEWKEIAKMIGIPESRRYDFTGTPAYKQLVKDIAAQKITIGGVFDEFPSKSSTYIE